MNLPPVQSARAVFFREELAAGRDRAATVIAGGHDAALEINGGPLHRATAKRPLSDFRFAGVDGSFGSGVPFRASRALPLTVDARDGGQATDERERMAGSKVLRTYVLGKVQRQVSTVAVVHLAKPTDGS
jgi:hypothetical protein